ncbi:MAG: hypothetical protein ACR2PT_13140 [Endozoicomonas sp.]
MSETGEILYTPDDQVIITVPGGPGQPSQLQVYNAAAGYLNLLQTYSSDDYTSLQRVNGLSQHPSAEQIAVSTGQGQANAVTLFRCHDLNQELPPADTFNSGGGSAEPQPLKRNCRWDIKQIFNNTNTDLGINNPHRLSFSQDGQWLMAISESQNEAYLFGYDGANWHPEEKIPYSQAGTINTSGRIISIAGGFYISDSPGHQTLSVIPSQAGSSVPVTQVLSFNNSEPTRLAATSDGRILFVGLFPDSSTQVFESNDSIDNKIWVFQRVVNDNELTNDDTNQRLTGLVVSPSQSDSSEYLYLSFGKETFALLHSPDDQQLPPAGSYTNDEDIQAMAIEPEAGHRLALASRNAVVILESHARPLFANQSYHFNYDESQALSGNYRVGEAFAVDPDNNEEIQHWLLTNQTDLPFEWQDHQIRVREVAALNQTLVDLLSGQNVWSMVLLAHNSYGQEASVPITISFIADIASSTPVSPSPTEQPSVEPAGPNLPAIIAGTVVGVVVVVCTSAFTLYLCITRCKSSSKPADSEAPSSKPADREAPTIRPDNDLTSTGQNGGFGGDGSAAAGEDIIVRGASPDLSGIVRPLIVNVLENAIKAGTQGPQVIVQSGLEPQEMEPQEIVQQVTTEAPPTGDLPSQNNQPVRVDETPEARDPSGFEQAKQHFEGRTSGASGIDIIKGIETYKENTGKIVKHKHQ